MNYKISKSTFVRSIILFLLIIIFILPKQTVAQQENVGWDEQDSTVSTDLFDAVSVDQSNAWVVGDNGVVIHTSDGGNWTEETTPISDDLHSIDYYNRTFIAVGNGGTAITKTIDGDWIDVSPSTNIVFRSVSIVKADNSTTQQTTAFLAGENGEIWKTEDGGTNWENKVLNPSSDLYGIDFMNETYGLVVGENGEIFGTSNGGQTWEERESPASVTSTLRDVVYVSDIRAFIVGDNGVFLRSTDNENPIVGWVWDKMVTNTAIHLTAIVSTSINKLWISGFNGTILQTRDGGFSFTAQKIPPEFYFQDIYSITVYSGKYGWSVGIGGLLLHTDRAGIAARDIPTVKNYNDWGVFLDEALPILNNGFRNMLEIIFISMALGFVIGILLAIFKTVGNPSIGKETLVSIRSTEYRLRIWIPIPLRVIATIYTDIIRNTPLLVQILVIHFGLPEIGIDMDEWLIFNNRLFVLDREFISAILSLGINSGAYQGEIIRSGIQAIPKGQMEAGRSIGLTYLQTMRHVILPQALRITIPPLGNEVVNLTLNSALVMSIGMLELTRAGRLIIAVTFLNLRTWSIVLLYYFVVTYMLTNLLRWVEHKTKIPGLGAN
ncbi:MAG: ABC transporter permease subunit [Candidatus Hodarchaeales archaeon]|jgi:polar amino acid transport system permease protein